MTVTKALIDELRTQGKYPFVATWGATSMYNVDAVALTPRKGKGYIVWKTYKHLYERGLVHNAIGPARPIRDRDTLDFKNVPRVRVEPDGVVCLGRVG